MLHSPVHKQLRRFGDGPKRREAEMQLTTGEYVKSLLADSPCDERVHPGHVRAIAFRKQELEEYDKQQMRAKTVLAKQSAWLRAHKGQMKHLHAELGKVRDEKVTAKHAGPKSTHPQFNLRTRTHGQASELS